MTYATPAESFNIAVGRYVIMPDHLHFFVRGGDDFLLPEWVKGLKRGVTNAFASTANRPAWQPGFFDHLLRNDESYAQKWNYVRDNPVRAGLVKAADDWPYAGEIITIDRA
ncbi:MAG: REP-associated tyrosine transposase [Verrucomicrobiota bacterium]